MSLVSNSTDWSADLFFMVDGVKTQISHPGHHLTFSVRYEFKVKVKKNPQFCPLILLFAAIFKLTFKNTVFAVDHIPRRIQLNPHLKVTVSISPLRQLTDNSL